MLLVNHVFSFFQVDNKVEIYAKKGGKICELYWIVCWKIEIVEYGICALCAVWQICKNETKVQI